MADHTALFEALFSHPKIADKHMYTWKLAQDRPGGLSQWYFCKDWLHAANEAYKQDDIYFGMGVSGMTGNAINSWNRIENKQVEYLTALWLDIDYDSPYRKKEKLPPNYSAISCIFDDIPEASFQVNSGYGLHCYWVFKEPVVIDNSNRDIARAWNSMFKKKFDDLGYNVDSTSLAQVLRCPGSLNYKNEDDPRPVDILLDTGKRYSFNELRALLTLRSISYEEPVDLTEYDFDLNPDVYICDDKIEIWKESYRHFARVWDGSALYPSQSERDMALASMLAGCGEEDQIIVDALVMNRRELGVSREKLRKDYYARTIAQARRSELANVGRIALNPLHQVISRIDTNPLSAEEVEEVTQEMDATRADMIENIKNISGLEVIALTKIQTTPVSYALEYALGGVKYSASFASIKELTMQSSFNARIMEQSNVFVPSMKKGKWDKLMSYLLPLCEEDKSGAIMNAKDEFKSKVNEYAKVMASEVIESTEGTHGRESFFMYMYNHMNLFMSIDGFQRWHNREGFPERLTKAQITIAARDCGGQGYGHGTEKWLRFKVEKFGDNFYLK
jgi:hypothetical protein